MSNNHNADTTGGATPEATSGKQNQTFDEEPGCEEVENLPIRSGTPAEIGLAERLGSPESPSITINYK